MGGHLATRSAVVWVFVLLHLIATCAGETISFFTSEMAHRGYSYIQEWEAATGNEVSIYEVTTELLTRGAEFSLDLKVEHIHDVYVKPPNLMMGEVAGYVEDLTAAVRDEKFAWNEIGPLQRLYVSTFNLRTYSIPIDADPVLLYFRRDLIASPPTTWDELIEVAREFHGKDLNGDGEPDYGFCLITGANSYVAAFTIANTIFRYANSRRDHFLYDVSDDTKPMALVLQTKGVSQQAPMPHGAAPNNSIPLVSSGRCATILSFPSHGPNTVRAPAGDFMRGRLGVARTPGSPFVYDRQSKSMTNCTRQLCTFQQGGINRPHFSFPGLQLVIRKGSPHLKSAIDFAAFVSRTVDVRQPGTLNAFRQHHFNASWFSELQPLGWDLEDAVQYISAISGELDKETTITLPEVRNLKIVLDQFVKAIDTLLFDPDRDVGAILKELDEEITKQSLANGFSLEQVEDDFRKDRGLPPRNSAASSTFPWAIIVVFAVGILILMVLALVSRVVMIRRRYAFAPKDSTKPFATLIARMHPDQLIRMLPYITTVSDKHRCYVSSQMGESVAIVSNHATDAFECGKVLFNKDIFSLALWYGSGQIVESNNSVFHHGHCITRALELVGFAKSHQLICTEEFIAVLRAEQQPMSEIEEDFSVIAVQQPESPSSFIQDMVFVGQVSFHNGANFRVFAYQTKVAATLAMWNPLANRSVSRSICSNESVVDQKRYATLTAERSRQGTVLLVCYDTGPDSAEEAINAIVKEAEDACGTVEVLSNFSAMISFNVHVPNILHEHNSVNCAVSIARSLKTLCDFQGVFVANGQCGVTMCQLLNDKHSSGTKFAFLSSTAVRDVWAMNRAHKSSLLPVSLLFLDDIALAIPMATARIGSLKLPNNEVKHVSTVISSEIVKLGETNAKCVSDVKQGFLLASQGNFEKALEVLEPYVSVCEDVHIVALHCKQAAGVMKQLAGPKQSLPPAVRDGARRLLMSVDSSSLHSQMIAKEAEANEEPFSDQGLVSMFCGVADSGSDEVDIPIRFTDVDGTTWVRSKSPLGSGAFSDAFLVLSTQGRPAAIKCFDRTRKTVLDSAQIATEVATLSKLHHNNVVSYVSYYFTARYFLLITEYVSGGSLGTILSNFGAIPASVLRVFLHDLLKGLAYLHKHGITHCDIKPQNLFLASDGSCKLGDVGSAINKVDIELSITGEDQEKDQLSGFTLRYMAPELLQGKASFASDTWSLACSVLELATGKPPFWEHSGAVLGLLELLKKGGIPTVPSNVEGTLGEFLRACLVRDPSKRPTAAQLLESEMFR